MSRKNGQRPHGAREFWRQVKKIRDGCWLWQGAVHPRGWGHTCYEGVREGAHRIAWRIKRDPHLEEFRQLRRLCDAPLCVNPDHHEIVIPKRIRKSRAKAA